MDFTQPPLLRDQCANKLFDPKILQLELLAPQFKTPVQLVNDQSPRTQKTALIIAAEGNYLQGIINLLATEKPRSKIRINLDLKDSNGKTAMDYAIQNKNREILSLLIDFQEPYLPQHEKDEKVSELLKVFKSTEQGLLHQQLDVKPKTPVRKVSIIPKYKYKMKPTPHDWSFVISTVKEAPHFYSLSKDYKTVVKKLLSTPTYLKPAECRFACRTEGISSGNHKLGLICGKMIFLYSLPNAPQESPECIGKIQLKTSAFSMMFTPFGKSCVVREGPFKLAYYSIENNHISLDGLLIDDQNASSYTFLPNQSKNCHFIIVGRKDGTLLGYKIHHKENSITMDVECVWTVRALNRMSAFFKNTGHSGKISQISADLSGKYILTVSPNDNFIKMFNSITGTFTTQYTAGKLCFTRAIFTPIGGKLYIVAGTTNGRVLVFESSHNKDYSFGLFEPGSPAMASVTGLYYLDSKQILASSHSDNVVRFWDIEPALEKSLLVGKVIDRFFLGKISTENRISSSFFGPSWLAAQVEKVLDSGPSATSFAIPAGSTGKKLADPTLKPTASSPNSTETSVSLKVPISNSS